jgi:hypothetical protein
MKRTISLFAVAMAALGQPPVVRNLLITNDGSTGTTLQQLAKINSSGNAVNASTTDTSVPVFIVNGGAGTTGSATLASGGLIACKTDAGGATIQHYIVASTATAGRCMDSGIVANGSNPPPAAFVVGIAQTTAAANANTNVALASSGSGGGGTGNAGANVQVTNSATPAFTCPTSTAGTIVNFHMVSALSANITSSTLTGCTGSSSLVSVLKFVFTQNSNVTGGGPCGGPCTVAMPTGFSQACQISPLQGTDTNMSFTWDGTTAHLDSCQTTGTGVGAETAAPGAAAPSGYEFPWFDSTGLFPRWENSAGTIFQAAKEGTGFRLAGGANTPDSFVASSGTGPVCLASGSACSGSTISDAFASGQGSDCWWGCDSAGSSTFQLAANVLHCWEGLPRATETAAGFTASTTGNNSAKLAFYIYNSAGTSLLKQTTPTVPPGGAVVPQVFTSPIQFQLSTTYILCASVDTSTTVSLATTNTNNAIRNGSTIPRNFTAQNPSSWSGSTPNPPSTLGTRTALAEGTPLVMFYQ